MTGVLLGGASPETAIKCKIMIMIAIVASAITSVVFAILLIVRICFKKREVLRLDVFVNNGARKNRD